MIIGALGLLIQLLQGAMIKNADRRLWIGSGDGY